MESDGIGKTATAEGTWSEGTSSTVRLTAQDGADGRAESSWRGSAPAQAIKLTARREQRTPAEPRAFEWIPHGDSTARRRARAHISRGFRRRKTLEAQAQDESTDIEGSASTDIEGSTSTDIEGSTSSSSSGIQTDQESTAASPGEAVLANRFQDVVDDRSSAQKLIEELFLRRTLGFGGRSDDPFQCFPMKLSPHNQAILDHFLFVVAPASYLADSRADFQRVKKLTFDAALEDPSGFHVILAVGANHIAIMKGKQDSDESILHRSIALKLVNERLSRWGEHSDDGYISDSNIAAVALLAGHELLLGSHQIFNMHMDGLKTMLDLRGGLDSFRFTKPGLYAMILWFDQAALCNLVSKRRFNQVGRSPPPPAPNQSPENIIRDICQGLPAGYDLPKVISDIFQRLGIVTSVIKGGNSTNAERFESSSFVSRVDAQLFRSISVPDKVGSTSRRLHLTQVFHIVVLIYVTLLSGYEGPSIEVFLYRFEELFKNEATELGRVIVKLFRLLLAGVTFESEIFTAEMSRLIDACVVMGWSPWRDIKVALLNFLVLDPACQGQLQDLWKHRNT